MTLSACAIISPCLADELRDAPVIVTTIGPGVCKAGAHIPARESIPVWRAREEGGGEREGVEEGLQRVEDALVMSAYETLMAVEAVVLLF